MPTRNFGRASYKAYRLMGIVSLTATGELANLNDKPDFEQLPFRIMPPMWGFFVTTADISLPATRPFTYSEQIAYPTSAKSIRIQDADGFQDVAIAEVVIPPMIAKLAAEADGNYCVFRVVWATGQPSPGGINPLLLAKCDTILPAIYARVFGPATEAECKKYINEHGGIAA